MRGQYLHNEIMAAQVERCFIEAGATALRECYFSVHGAQGYVDLSITHDGRVIVCEIERSADRVLRDLDKAVALAADLLLIVVPNRRTAVAATRAFTRAGIQLPAAAIPISILPLGPAMQWIRKRGHLMIPRYVPTSSGHKSGFVPRSPALTPQPGGTTK